MARKIKAPYSFSERFIGCNGEPNLKYSSIMACYEIERRGNSVIISAEESGKNLAKKLLKKDLD